LPFLLFATPWTRTPLTAEQNSKRHRAEDIQVAALNTWRVTDQSARHSLILAGIGWGNLPEALVKDELASGRLVRLSVRGDGRFQQVRSLRLVVAHRQDEAPGPAGRWLLARLSGTVLEV
jgi:DNA-binding transcriptional LysR family regulator